MPFRWAIPGPSRAPSLGASHGKTTPLPRACLCSYLYLRHDLQTGSFPYLVVFLETVREAMTIYFYDIFTKATGFAVQKEH